MDPGFRRDDAMGNGNSRAPVLDSSLALQCFGFVGQGSETQAVPHPKGSACAARSAAGPLALGLG